LCSSPAQCSDYLPNKSYKLPFLGPLC